MLNFGHTVGHAVEAASGYSLLHGEAVAIGMFYEARVAEAMRLAESGMAQRLAAVLGSYRLPVTRPAAASVDQLISRNAERQEVAVRRSSLRIASYHRSDGHGGVASGWTVAAPEGMVRELLTVKQ